MAYFRPELFASGYALEEILSSKGLLGIENELPIDIRSDSPSYEADEAI